jgi:hypothetical protein
MRGKSWLFILTLFLLSSCAFFNEQSDEETYGNSSPIAIPNLYLSYFSQGRKDSLFRYLASSSKWHVTSLDGGLLAFPRESFNPCVVPKTLGLPSSYPDGEIPFMSLGGGTYLNFSPEKDWFGNKSLQSRAIENTTHSLKLRKIDHKSSVPSNDMESSLIVEAHDKSLNLAISEHSDGISRKHTRETLTDVSYQLKKLAHSNSMNDQEIDPSMLPPGSMKYSQNQIVSIKEGEGKFRGYNRYVISGYVNLGKKGFVYVKVLYTKNKKQILGDTTSTNAEYVGWSSDPKKKFNFCIGMSTDGTAKDVPSFPADIQLWFHPSDGSQEIMISQQTVRLKARD